MRSPDPVLASSANDSSIVARFTPLGLGDSATAPRWIQWMPGGVHEIAASQGGKPVRVRVQVDRQTAVAAQQALGRLTAAGRQRPFFDFDHANGRAAGWPTAFEWRDVPEPGVYAEVEWSASGTEAIRGRDYRAFSPAFFVDSNNPARVTGIPMNAGALVNDPAFRQIAPIWSKAAPNQPNRSMNHRKKLIACLAAIAALQNQRKILAAQPDQAAAGAAIAAKDSEIQEKFVEAGQLQAEIDAEAGHAPDSGAINPVRVEIADATAALEAKDTEIAELRSKVLKAENDLKARREQDADSAVKAAVARGAVPAANADLQKAWRDDLVANPEAVRRLEAIPSNPALQARLTSPQAAGVVITREDSQVVLKAYHDERDPVARGRIYARDIRSRIERGEDLPILAATNTLGTLAADLVSQRALDLLILQFPMLSSISTDFSAEPIKYGKQISTRIVSIPTVGTYHTTNGYVSQDTTTTDVDVTIDSHKFVQHEFGANELSGTTRNLWTEMAPAMAYALGKDLVDALYALITAANYTNAATTITAANFDRAGVIKVAKALTGRGVPNVNRALLLNSDYYAALMEDPAIVSLAAYQQAAVITQGQLPPVHNFRVYEAVNMPTTGNLTGFGVYPSAWAMAVRLPAEYANSVPGASGGGVVNVITEPNTGLSVHQVMFIDHKLGKAYGRVAWMFGVAKADINAGQRLISAAP